MSLVRYIGVAAVSVAAAWAAAPDCAACHPDQVSRYLASPMGRSLSAAPESVRAAGTVSHALSGAKLSAEFRAGRMYHVLTESGLTAEYPVAYQIGSGLKGRTYAVRVGDYLLESPLSWYRNSGWDVSPGYESLALLDFDRPIATNCLFCHASRSPGTDADGRRTAAQPLQAISCDRCHGAGERHALNPSTANIVNPAKLTGPARVSVCEQCHLEGDVRVVNPGKTVEDYRVGEPLEKTAVTYLLRVPGQVDTRAVTQVEEIAESRCAKSSQGRFWCGTCHHPHGASLDRSAQLARVCRSCHATVSKPVHDAVADCASCHMPRRGASDIAHTAITDHRLLKRPSAAAKNETPAGHERVLAWREPPPEFRRRNLALAGLQIGIKDQKADLLAESVKLLETVPPAQQQNDPEMLAALEAAFLGRAAPEKAVALGKWAVESLPASATFAFNYGVALKRTGDTKRAEQEWLRAITLDPSFMQAYAELAVLYDSQGKRAKSLAVLERFLAWNPQNIQFRLARGKTIK